MTTRAMSLLLLLCAACSRPAPSAPQGPSPVSSARAAAAIDEAVFDKICHAEHVDSSSTVFQAFGPGGDVRRLVVTPSRKIADMGNLVFDTKGDFLGTDTGSEVPWEDKDFMEKEHRRVAALMGESEIPNGFEPIQCK